MKVSAISVANNNPSKSKKSNQNVNFDGRYINPNGIPNKGYSLVVTKAVQSLGAFFEKAVGSLDKYANRVTKLELKELEKSLAKSSVKFNQQQTKEVKRLYTRQNAEILDRMLIASEVQEYKPEHVIQILQVQKKYPEAIDYSFIGNGGDWGTFDNSADTLNGLMRRLPPETPEKKVFFKDRDIEAAIKKTYEMNNRMRSAFTMKDAEDIIYRAFGRRPE